MDGYWKKCTQDDRGGIDYARDGANGLWKNRARR